MNRHNCEWSQRFKQTDARFRSKTKCYRFVKRLFDINIYIYICLYLNAFCNSNNSKLIMAENRILKDSNDDLKANSIVEEEIDEGNGGNASKTKVGNEDDLKSTCSDDEEEDVNKEAIEDLISKLHINGDQLPTISSPLNNLRCRGRSTLMLFYRLWRDHLVKKPPL
ncbi:hypothetical protein EJD97_015257 [Solanum chilense]|uniref:Uncharacterized protein n=1 Tax=Solanum chilense TaxID=4083 RepID=A0A6N2CFC6_SOLCI|nr:hypothetical protein EJD97_015257 [Solanum chilense]